MFDWIFSFGSSVLGFVAPIFILFKQEGFAPFLAFLMFAFTVSLATFIYFRFILPGKKSLGEVLAKINSVQSQADFSSRFNEIDESFNSTKTLKHGWEEFCETLIKPDSNHQSQVIRNTIRPSYYLNTTDIETRLHLKVLHFVSNLLVGVGLLLTFIGLVAALTFATCGISEEVTGALAKICSGASGGQLESAIKDLLHAASLKFWTSVSGLGCSIILRVFYEVQHNSIKALINEINVGIERGLQFVTPEYLAIENLREAQEQSATMKRFSTDLAMTLAEKIQDGFAAALSPVHESLNNIGERITGGIGDAIQGAAGSEMQQMAKNMGGIVESLNASRAEMDGMGSAFRIAMDEAAKSMKTASSEASNEMSQKMQDVIASLAEDSRKQSQIFDESMNRLSVMIDQAGQAAGGTVQKAANDLASGMNGVTDGVRDSAATMADRMDSLSSVLQNIEDRMNAHVQAMDALTGRARDTEQAMGLTSRHLSDAAAPVAQASNRMATTAEQLSLSAQTVYKTIEESHQDILSLTKKIEETQNVLQDAWKAYDSRFSEVDESLARAVHGIVDNVRDNMQSMEKFVLGVDQKLGAAVQSFAQSISELNDTAESFESASSKLLIATDRIADDKKVA